MYTTTDISTNLKSSNVSFDRVRKHGDDGYKISKVDPAEAQKALEQLEGASFEAGENSLTVTFSKPEAEAPKQEAAEQTERTKNPEYDVVFDMAIQALQAGDTLTEWKAGRKVRMMQTIRKLYAKDFEKSGRNVRFIGDVSKIDKNEVLANLGLKTARSLPKTESAEA